MEQIEKSNNDSNINARQSEEKILNEKLFKESRSSSETQIYEPENTGWDCPAYFPLTDVSISTSL